MFVCVCVFLCICVYVLFFSEKKKSINVSKVVDKLEASKLLQFLQRFFRAIKKKCSIFYRDNKECTFMVTCYPLKNQGPKYKVIWRTYLKRASALCSVLVCAFSRIYFLWFRRQRPWQQMWKGARVQLELETELENIHIGWLYGYVDLESYRATIVCISRQEESWRGQNAFLEEMTLETHMLRFEGKTDRNLLCGDAKNVGQTFEESCRNWAELVQESTHKYWK